MAERGESMIAVLGTGRCVPERVLTNKDLEKMVDTSDEWITERTGIKERFIASPTEATSDFAHPAALRALETAGVEPGELDAIICATVTADNPFPSLGCKVQALLGARKAFAFDISAACAGWIYSIGIGAALHRAGTANKVLVIGAECLSRITDWTDRSTCVLFGDGAGALVLGPGDPGRGVLACRMASDGRRYDLLLQPAGGSRNPPSHETVERRDHVIRMNGNEVFKHAVRNMVDLSREALDTAGLAVEDVDLFIPHQANLRIIDLTAKRLGIDEKKVYVNVDRYGNTSAASIPIALDEAVRAGRAGPGDVVACVAFGGGFTYGAVVIRL